MEFAEASGRAPGLRGLGLHDFERVPSSSGVVDWSSQSEWPQSQHFQSKRVVARHAKRRASEMWDLSNVSGPPHRHVINGSTSVAPRSCIVRAIGKPMIPLHSLPVVGGRIDKRWKRE